MFSPKHGLGNSKPELVTQDIMYSIFHYFNETNLERSQGPNPSLWGQDPSWPPPYKMCVAQDLIILWNEKIIAEKVILTAIMLILNLFGRIIKIRRGQRQKGTEMDKDEISRLQ